MKKLNLNKKSILVTLALCYILAYMLNGTLENFRVKNQYEQDLYQSYQSYR